MAPRGTQGGPTVSPPRSTANTNMFNIFMNDQKEKANAHDQQLAQRQVGLLVSQGGNKRAPEAAAGQGKDKRSKNVHVAPQGGKTTEIVTETPPKRLTRTGSATQSPASPQPKKSRK